MSKNLQAQPTTTTTPTNWFVNIAGSVRQLTAAAFIALLDVTWARKDSPALTGTPTAPTASPGTNNTQIATTAYADAAATAAANAVVNAAPDALNTLKELADSLGDDANYAATTATALAARALAARTVNGHALTADVTVTKSDVGLSAVTNDAQLKAADLDTDSAFTADSDAKVPSQKAVKTALSGKAAATHATSHKSGGADAIKLDELAAPTDVTTLNATTSAHGLLPKLGGGTTNFLRADGTWAAPAGGGGGSLARGAGTLLGNTTPHGSPTPASSGCSFNTVAAGNTGTVTVDVNGTPIIITYAFSDPGDGSIFVDITSFTGAYDYAAAFESIMDAQTSYVTNVVRSEFYVTFDSTGTGSSFYVNTTASVSGVIASGYVNGGDGAVGSGAVTEVTIIAAVTGKKILPVRVLVKGGDISGMTADVCLKVGSSYYPLCDAFNAGTSYAELLGGTGYAPIGNNIGPWKDGLASGSLVARLIGDVTDGGSLTITGICEQF